MEYPSPQVNRGWRRMLPSDLEAHIRRIRQLSNHHSSLSQRQQLGRMEKRLAKLRQWEGRL